MSGKRWKRRAKRDRARAGSKPFPPGYVECLEKMARLIPEWIRAQPSPPELKFHEWGTVAFTGSLMDAATVRYLAASPDAEALLRWLGEQTDGQATLLQAKHVLAHLGAFRKPEPVRASKAMQTLEHFAHATGTTEDVPPSPCGHCGHMNEKASGMPGEGPSPGALAICGGCGGVNQYDERLHTVRVTDEEVEAFPPEDRAHVQDMQSLIRNARLRHGLPKKPGTVSA